MRRLTAAGLAAGIVANLALMGCVLYASYDVRQTVRNLVVFPSGSRVSTTWVSRGREYRAETTRSPLETPDQFAARFLGDMHALMTELPED